MVTLATFQCFKIFKNLKKYQEILGNQATLRDLGKCKRFKEIDQRQYTLRLV